MFFTYALVLTRIYNVAEHGHRLLLHLLRAGQPHRPSTIGRLFDTIGRRSMISFTYIVLGALLATERGPLQRRRAECGDPDGVRGASSSSLRRPVPSSAYLTVSEIFPVEVRAKAIAVFFAIAQETFGALSAPGSMENSSEVVRITSSC